MGVFKHTEILSARKMLSALKCESCTCRVATLQIVDWSRMERVLNFVKWIIGGVVFVLMLAMCTSGKPRQPLSSGEMASDLVKMCSNEAGIPTDNPSHKISKSEMMALTDCVDREKAKLYK